MDGASFNDAPEEQPQVDNGMDMNQEPNQETADMPQDAMPPMEQPENQDMSNNEPSDDSTMSIINQLSDTDREAVRAYAESMLNRDETVDNNSNENPDGPAEPMQETKSVIFTKGQLREMNENFGPTADELEKTKQNMFSKKTNDKNNKTPFDKPKFH